MMEKRSIYTFGEQTNRPYPEVLAAVKQALQDGGFGVHYEIDVQAKLQEKVGAEIPPYRILGVCKPELAYKAMKVDIEIGALLPCNVIVYQKEKEGDTVVAAMDPMEVMSIAQNTELDEIASEAHGALGKALQGLFA